MRATNKLAESLQVGAKCSYVYYFGDDWNHDILLDAVTKDTCYRPFCIQVKDACPPEDLDGLSGYAQMVGALADSKHSEYKSFQTWIGLEKNATWEPTFASTCEINKRLALLEMEEA